MKVMALLAMGMAFVSVPLTFASPQPAASGTGTVSQNATKKTNKKVKKHKKSIKNLPSPDDARKSQGFEE